MTGTVRHKTCQQMAASLHDGVWGVGEGWLMKRVHRNKNKKRQKTPKGVFLALTGRAQTPQCPHDSSPFLLKRVELGCLSLVNISPNSHTWLLLGPFPSCL